MRTTLGLLWFVQVAGYLIPLLGIPILAQRLGPEGWGHLALAQAIGLALGVVLEFGFNLSATREVSKVRDDRSALSRVVTTTLCAQVSLLVLVAIPSCGVAALLPTFHGNSALPWWGLVWTLPQSISMQWLFHGIGRPIPHAAANFLARVLGLVGIYLLVESPEHAGRALACQAIPGIAVIAVISGQVLHDTGWTTPRLADVAATLRSGFSLFGYRIGLVAYMTLLPAILAGYAGPLQLGLFAGAERIARAAAGLLDPMASILYPRWTRVLSEAESPSFKLMVPSLTGVLVVGAALSLLLWMGAQSVVRLLLGDRFVESGPVLAMLCWLPFAQAFTSVVATNYLLALNLDRLVVITFLLTSAVSLTVQTLTRPDAAGTACLVVGTQLVQGLLFAGQILYHQRLRRYQPC